MSKYFWDLNLSEIPLGWQEDYEYALLNCPHGKTISTPELSENGIIERKCFYNPVACRNLLLNEFSNYQKQAIELYHNACKENFQLTATELIRIDTILRSIIFYWVCDEHDISSFKDTSVYSDIHFCEYDCYFSFETLDYMKPYETYKFFRKCYSEDV